MPARPLLCPEKENTITFASLTSRDTWNQHPEDLNIQGLLCPKHLHLHTLFVYLAEVLSQETSPSLAMSYLC